MRKRGFYILILMLLLVLTIFTMSAIAADVYVSGSEDPGWYDATHVATINESINNASNGNEVYIYDGEYTCELLDGWNVSKELHFIGESKEGVLCLTHEGHLWNITADNVTIENISMYSNASAISTFIIQQGENFTLQKSLLEANGTTIFIYGRYSNFTNVNNISLTGNTSDNLMFFLHVDNITIENVTCNATTDYGIHIIGNNTLIQDCSFTGAIVHDILHLDTYVNDTIIRGNYLKNSEYGIRLDSDSYHDFLIYNNYFGNNTAHMKNTGDLGSATFNISKTLGTNIIGGPYLGGNFWDNYTGVDTNSDRLGDTLTPVYGDELPLTSATAVYVDDNAKPIWYDRDHVATIGEAVTNVSNSGTIYIWDGTYFERVNVSKNITIAGNSSSEVTLVETGWSMINVTNVDSVNISGINFSDGHMCYGIEAHYARNMTIYNCTFNENVISIYGQECDNITIYNCTFSNFSSDGINLFANPVDGKVFYPTIRDCDFIGTNFYDTDDGIEFRDGIKMNLYNLTFYRLREALLISTVTTEYSDLHINNITIDECGYGDVGTVKIINFYDVIVENVSCDSSAPYAILFDDVYDSVIKNCNLAESSTSITIYDCDNISIENVTTTLFDYGIELYEASNVSIGNCSTSNGDNGFIMTDVVSDCTFRNIETGEVNNSFVFNSTLDGDTIIRHNYLNATNVSLMFTQNYSLDGSLTIYNNYINGTDYDIFNDSSDMYGEDVLWNISKTSGVNIYGGPYLGGNYWSHYSGSDINGDGLGDTSTPYGNGQLGNGGDYSPLTDYGTVGINVYKESDPSIEITNYSVLVTNETGDITYYQEDCGNPFTVFIASLPTNELIGIQISADGYKSRTHYYNYSVIDTSSYSLRFYLPPDPAGGGEYGDDDYIWPSTSGQVLRGTSKYISNPDVDLEITLLCDIELEDIYSIKMVNTSPYIQYVDVPNNKFTVDDNVITVDSSYLDDNSTLVIVQYYCPNTEEYGQYYSITVSGPKSQYGSLQEIEDALLICKRYIDETDEWETMYRVYTDASGSYGMYLIPSTYYKFDIIADNYATSIGNDYIPAEDEITHVFILEPHGTPIDICTFDSFLNVNLTQTNSGIIWCNYSKVLDSSVLNWCNVSVYYIRNQTMIGEDNDSSPHESNSLDYEVSDSVGFVVRIKYNISGMNICNGVYSDSFIGYGIDNIGNGSNIEDIIEDVIGDSPFKNVDLTVIVPWIYLIVFFLALFVATTFSKQNGFVGMMGAGFVLLLAGVGITGLGILYTEYLYQGASLLTVGGLLIALGVVGSLGGVERR